MDFKKLANDLTKKASEAFDSAASFGAEKIAGSGFTIDTMEEFEEFIKATKQTTFKQEDGTEKVYDHTSIIVVGKEKSDFFKDALLHFPILVTKAFSQNINLKLAKAETKGLDLKKYNVKETPAILVFTNKKLVKIVEGEENIEKITKSFTMDIRSEIDKY